MEALAGLEGHLAITPAPRHPFGHPRTAGCRPAGRSDGALAEPEEAPGPLLAVAARHWPGPACGPGPVRASPRWVVGCGRWVSARRTYRQATVVVAEREGWP